MITILLQKILAALTQLLGDIKTKLNTIKDNLDDLIVVATASGPIASFTTTITKPFISFIVDVPESESGTDTVIITQTGANLWDEEWEVGNINTSGEDTPDNNIIRTKGYISIKPSTSYYAKIASSPYSSCRVFYYDQNKNFIEYKPLDKNLVFTTVSGAFYCRIRFATATTYNNDISINYPSTDTAYHAHVTATTKTVSLPQTVYGGEVDITDSILPEIKAKNGVNNIFTDSGDVTIEYLKLYKEV